MESNRFSLALALSVAFFLTLLIAPAYGANKELIELQTQVAQLQQQMTQMKQSFDERMGVMKSLLEKNTDAANKVSAAIGDLQTSINKQQQDRAAQVDQISGQIQALNDTMDELKVRLARLSKEFEDMQAAQQTLAAQQAQAQQQAQAIAQAPAPDVLYNNALRDYNGGKNDLATQEFSDYIKFYPNTDLAGNSYFYLAEIEYKAADYTESSRELRSGAAEFSQRKQGCHRAVKEGVRAPRTRQTRRWRTRTEACHSALSKNHGSYASQREAAETGSSQSQTPPIGDISIVVGRRQKTHIARCEHSA